MVSPAATRQVLQWSRLGVVALRWARCSHLLSLPNPPSLLRLFIPRFSRLLSLLLGILHFIFINLLYNIARVFFSFTRKALRSTRSVRTTLSLRGCLLCTFWGWRLLTTAVFAFFLLILPFTRHFI